MRPSWRRVFISFAPKFQSPGAFLGIRFLIFEVPKPEFLFLPIPCPPSPIPRERPSELPRS